METPRRELTAEEKSLKMWFLRHILKDMELDCLRSCLVFGKAASHKQIEVSEVMRMREVISTIEADIEDVKRQIALLDLPAVIPEYPNFAVQTVERIKRLRDSFSGSHRQPKLGKSV
ncbi:hypothetical protein CAPTEDRAFT_207216 [Capitella teleta]|uniref:Uncharacterized protein n=1 Tax=Capitella teleta TaxID=283909 RepID=R7TCY4_CAPTE|nr:hypothetical protein CAPTEDRAFT_207216 [Capitella teleta]|eukprot:ELT89342.1 hypothetical protein CAPTEDRAFT_207216 [Capitella teleta]